MHEETIDETADDGKTNVIATGELKDFVACFAGSKRGGRKVCIDPEAAEMLGVKPGDTVLAEALWRCVRSISTGSSGRPTIMRG